ncbi:MAG TPA: DUF6364 family protein [Kiritimatiellia bacterium]|nr:DUF6364 family protein [Kiritimatiellia bacterium]
MKNVTISLPDELAHKAKVFAAEHNTSVSRYVGELLAARLESEKNYRNAYARWSSRALKPLGNTGIAYPERGALYDR